MPPKKKKGAKKGTKKGALKVNALEVVLKSILDRTVELIQRRDEGTLRAAVKIQAAWRGYCVRKQHPEFVDVSLSYVGN